MANNRRSLEIANAVRRSGGMHCHAFEMTVYYITHVLGKPLYSGDSMIGYHFKYVSWCVRHHLPWGMTGECTGTPSKHRYRTECISMGKDGDQPVILTIRGLEKVKWTLDYYSKNPAKPWPLDDTLYGRAPSGRKSFCERCANADNCEWAPVYGWHGCKIGRFTEK